VKIFRAKKDKINKTFITIHVKDIHNLYTLVIVVGIVEYRTVIGSACSFSEKRADVWNIMAGKFFFQKFHRLQQGNTEVENFHSFTVHLEILR